jgi:hypothetical protein
MMVLLVRHGARRLTGLLTPSRAADLDQDRTHAAASTCFQTLLTGDGSETTVLLTGISVGPFTTYRLLNTRI